VVSAAARISRHRSIDAVLRALAAEFRPFDFGTLRMRDGISLAAIRRKPDEPGLYAVITDSEDEMREALREDADQSGGPDG